MSSCRFPRLRWLSLLVVVVILVAALPLLAATENQHDEEKDGYNVAIPTTRFDILDAPLYKHEGYNHTISVFGLYPKDVTISASLLISRSTFCSPVTDLKFANLVDYPTDQDAVEMKYFIMVPRGGCTFEKKTRNAQMDNLLGLVIANNVCVCSDSDCSPQTNCGERMPHMAASQLGWSHANIPVFMIKKQDADSIQNFQMNHEYFLNAKMTFSIPSFGEPLEYKITTNVADQKSEAFLASFGPTAMALSKYTTFTPQYQFWSSDCAGSCDLEGCTNVGRYCGMLTDEDQVDKPKGKTIMQEILRRGCIWKEYGKQGTGKEWWNYIKERHTSCDEMLEDKVCTQHAMVSVGIDTSKIDSCMLYSGGLEANQDNAILEELDSPYDWVPNLEVGVNVLGNPPMRDYFTKENVRMAICDGFVDGYRPAICSSLSDDKEEQQTLPQTTKPANRVRRIPFLLVIVLLSMIAGYCMSLEMACRQATPGVSGNPLQDTADPEDNNNPTDDATSREAISFI